MSNIQHNFFLPTCCNVCVVDSTITAVKPVKLLKCLGCKLILYCSQTHQKLDWPIHKHFCKAVCKLLTEYKVNHLFAIAGPIRTQNDLSAVKVKIKCQLVSLLKRQLEYHEEELTSFPVMCSVCFSTKYNSLYQCKGCKAVSYCCPEHELAEALAHQKECLQLKLHYSKFKIDSNCVFKVELRQICSLLKYDLGKAMSTMFGIEFAPDPSESLNEYQKFSFVSDFSCVATVSYFIEHLKKIEELTEEFILIIAGSTVDEIWFTPLHVGFFFACFPRILKLSIIFIGPEIPENSIKNTTTALDNGRSFFRTSFQGTLEKYLQTDTNLKPDLIVCFNCGFSENAQTNGPSDSWYKGIQHFMELPDIPILFTSYTSLEADNDFRALKQVIEERKKDNRIRLERIAEKQLNPYRDLRPLRNWQFNDPERIFFRNGYLQAVRVIDNANDL